MHKIFITLIIAVSILSCTNAGNGSSETDSTYKSTDSTNTIDTVINQDTLNDYDGNRM
jgi:hypothetical protein